MLSQQEKAKPPSLIAARLPSIELLEQALSGSVTQTPPGRPLIRAVWNKMSVWPEQVNRTYRFGPPDALTDADGRYPFHWIYAADEVSTAAWEAQLCANDATRPGTFYIPPGAADALVATLLFDQPIRLFDLTGIVVSKLGLYDDIRSPDYEWCQWFGTLLDQLIVSQQGGLHGFRYPSRRHPGHDAYAISSRVMGTLDKSLSISTESFGATSEFALLSGDSCCVDPP